MTILRWWAGPAATPPTPPAPVPVPTGAYVWGGFLRDDAVGLLVTSEAGGATWQGGFLRDPNGRLVVEHG